MNIPSEHDEQVQLITWARLNAWKYPELKMLLAIPNGGHRHKSVAGKLRAEGVRAGVPDLFLPVPAGDYCGMWVEMKRRKRSTTSPEQKEWIAALLANHYHVIVAKGWEEARDGIEEYLALIEDHLPPGLVDL